MVGDNPADVPFALADPPRRPRVLSGRGLGRVRLPQAVTEFTVGASLDDEICRVLSAEAPRTLTGLARLAATPAVRPGWP